MNRPETRYAWNGEVSLAYQTARAPPGARTGRPSRRPRRARPRRSGVRAPRGAARDPGRRPARGPRRLPGGAGAASTAAGRRRAVPDQRVGEPEAADPARHLAEDPSRRRLVEQPEQVVLRTAAQPGQRIEAEFPAEHRGDREDLDALRRQAAQPPRDRLADPHRDREPARRFGAPERFLRLGCSETDVVLCLEPAPGSELCRRVSRSSRKTPSKRSRGGAAIRRRRSSARFGLDSGTTTLDPSSETGNRSVSMQEEA